tara:strand:+ start:2191 stop:2631 length:441 start_codon:yes stop_codon:yes gene_type:complete
MNDITEAYDNIKDLYLKFAKDYLSVSDQNMDVCLQKHTSIYAFFGAVLAHAKDVLNDAEADFEYQEALCREARRKELQESGQKATDRALDAYLKTVPSLREQSSVVREAQHKYNLAKNLVSSLDHQKDMLVQMSANKRAEIKLHEL